jgi:hypothetical protein
MSIDVISFILGGALVAVGLLGGGIEVRELKIPPVGRTTRVLSFLGGLAFVGFAIFMSLRSRNGVETHERQAETNERRTFIKPMYEGLRLDTCFVWGNRCGEEPANAWCQKNRYTHAVDYNSTEVVGRQGTKLIGTGQVCKEDFCSGFKYITCEN